MAGRERLAGLVRAYGMLSWGKEEVAMTQTLEAVFENGVFRPLVVPPALTEGQHVRLVVQPEVEPEDILALAAQVYAGLSEPEIGAIEAIALDRRPFFEQRP